MKIGQLSARTLKTVNIPLGIAKFPWDKTVGGARGTFVLLDQLNRDRLGQSSVGIICIKPGYHKGLNSRGLI